MKFSVALAAVLLASLTASVHAEDLDKTIPAPRLDPASKTNSDTVVLAGGCFWGQQGLFEHVNGVTRVVSGYSGGAKATATYPQVGTETTGHAESIQITYDPSKVSFGTLLRIYFSVAHDPTELNFQGPDHGSSYRSEIFFSTPEQEKTARAYVAQLTAAGIFTDPIVTRIEPLKGFYDAEAYHQDFLVHNPTQPYILYVDMPKLAAFRHVWPQYYRADPVLLAAR